MSMNYSKEGQARKRGRLHREDHLSKSKSLAWAENAEVAGIARA